MRNNRLNESIIVCVSTLCILTMVMMNNVKTDEDLEQSQTINALIMKSDGISLGLISDEVTGNNALNKVKDIYINTANIENIKGITIDNEIVYEATTCNKEDILDENELSNIIIKYNNASDESIVSFTATKESEVRYIKRKTQGNEQVAFTIASRGNSELNREVFLHNSITTPIKGILTSTFGEQRDGYNHKGIDMAADTGTKIQAALDGIVSFSGGAEGYGNVVIIDHGDNIETVYAHCSKLKAATGDQILRGEVIAEVGNTGDSTGPHLHFEIRVGGMPMDPLRYTGANEY